MNIGIIKMSRIWMIGFCCGLDVLAGCSRTEDPDAAGNSDNADPQHNTASGEISAPDALSGHARMLALLQEIIDRTPTEHTYLGQARIQRVLGRLATLPPQATAIDRALLNARVGIELLAIGRTQEAIDHLVTAYDMIPQLPPTIQQEASTKLGYDLGIAYLRLAENQNCVTRHTSDSCILPIRGGGVHVDQEGSRQAIKYFERTLKLLPAEHPVNADCRWLANIAYMTLGQYPDGVPSEYLISPKTFESDEDFPRFVNIAPQLGLDTVDLAGGAIADDFNGDNLLDIVTSTWDTAGSMHYYQNNGDGTFLERTKEAGLTGIVGGLNLEHADYDNDGDLDILVLRGAWLVGRIGQHPNSLLQNDGKGNFVDVTFDAGLGEAHYPTQTAAWSDYDLDGDLDLYVGNESPTPDAFPSQLFRNNGDGTFTDVARAAGVQNFRYAKGVTWGDVNGDRYPDLYVSNLSSGNRLYINGGDGKFTDVADSAGVAKPLLSFPVWFWDFDNDGVLDLFVSSYYYDYNAAVVDRLYPVVASYLGLPHDAELACLYRGDGTGGFKNVASEQNLDKVTLPMGANFGDLDNDGFPDFYMGTGYPSFDGLMPNVMYRNLRGKGFADITTAGGFGHLQKGHGIAFADFDNDGDLDVFEQMGGAYPGDAFGNVLYENPGTENHWINVKLIGTKSNRCAIGARICVEITEDGASRKVYRHVNSGGSFGANPLTQHIGIGSAVTIDNLEVFWPRTGETQQFDNVPVDKSIRILEGSPTFDVVPKQQFTFAR